MDLQIMNSEFLAEKLILTCSWQYFSIFCFKCGIYLLGPSQIAKIPLSSHSIQHSSIYPSLIIRVSEFFFSSNGFSSVIIGFGDSTFLLWGGMYVLWGLVSWIMDSFFRGGNCRGPKVVWFASDIIRGGNIVLASVSFPCRPAKLKVCISLLWPD